MVKFMRGFMVSVAFAALAISFAQTQVPTSPAVAWTPSFSPDAVSKVMNYWSQQGRYAVTLPDNYHDKGLWQVRLTVAGSTWIWNYNKARKASAPPTQDPTAANGQQQIWDKWIQSKVDRDRWEAGQVALQANIQVLGAAPMVPEKGVPTVEPPRPGPMPTDLQALAGPAPKFAEATVPMQHRVVFDDFAVNYLDKVKLGNPKYAYYRFASGVMDEGKAVKTLPADRMKSLMSLAGLDDSTARIMMAVSMLEGGFDSINTYDTGFVSAGFIQFACLKEGGGALGGLLTQYKADKPDKYAADFQQFGIDIATDGKLDVLDPDTGGEYHGSDAALKIIDDKRLIAVFQRAGQLSDDFIAEQIKAAKSMFFPADDMITVSLNGTPTMVKVSDIVKSEAGLATLMDRKVNTGSLGQFQSFVALVADQAKAATVDDLAKFEATLVTALKYRQNYLSDPTLSQPAPPPFEIHLPQASGKR